MSKDIGLNEYQRLAERYNKKRGSVVYLALGLCGESGEVAEKLKKHFRGTDAIKLSESLPSDVAHAIALELGDVQWYLSQLATAIGYTLEDIADMNLQKLGSRAERGVLYGEGDYR